MKETQVHPLCAETLTLPPPPPALVKADPGLMENPHETPGWEITNCFPATVIVPERELVLGFGAAVNVTVPFPMPRFPEVTVIQGSLLTATQLHPVWVVTPKLPPPPPAGVSAEPGAIENVHAGAAA